MNSNSANSSSGRRRPKTFSSTTTRIAPMTTCSAIIAASMTITDRVSSRVQAEVCRRKFEKFDGRVRVVVADFDGLDLPGQSFDAIYALESIGYTKDLDAWLARCWRMLKPGGPLRSSTPG